MSAEPQLSDAPEPRAPVTSVAPSRAPLEDDLFDEITKDSGPPTFSEVPLSPATPVIAGIDGSSRRQQRRQARQQKGLKARQVHRIVRRIDVWSVFKVAAIFSFCLWLVLVVAGIILWRVAVAMGAIDNVEKFMAELLAEKSFTVDGQQILRAAAVGGVILVCAGTAFAVLLSTLFNLISQVVGGVRFTVVELETATSGRTAETAEQRVPRRRRREI